MDRRRRAAQTVALMSLFATTDMQTDVPIASFDGDGSDLISLIVGIEPVQNLHGFDNPWPAGGGVNLLPPYSLPSITDQGVTLTHNNGEYTLNGKTDSNVAVFDVNVNLPAGQYTVALNNPTTNAKVQIYGIGENAAVPLQVLCNTANATATATFAATVKIFRIRVLANGTVDNFKLSPVFSAGATAATQFYPYENICPISGWTGANIHVSSTTDAADGETYSITFPSSAGTVYGGTLDVTTGKLTVDRAIVDLGTLAWYANGAISGGTQYAVSIADKKPGETNFICSAYKTSTPNAGLGSICGRATTSVVACNATQTALADFKAAVTGQTIVYELATPIVYDLTPEEITTLIGTNNIWADTGDIKYIEYNI